MGMTYADDACIGLTVSEKKTEVMRGKGFFCAAGVEHRIIALAEWR